MTKNFLLRNLKEFGAIPCSICGEYPIIQGNIGYGGCRLVCPNYKSKESVHGSLSADTNGIVMGFTGWNYHFCSLEMAEREGVPELVSEWNDIHHGHKTNADIWPYENKEVI